MNKKPNLFLLGAPKCGTTSMMHYLSEHPQIFVSPEKEPHFFNTDSKRRYYKDKKEYLSLFNDASSEHRYLSEGSVWYLYSTEAVKNIERFAKDPKYIVMLRNPTDLFFSLHQELLYGGSENVVSPIEAWNLQSTRKEGNKIPIGCLDPKLLNYGKACKLGEQVELLLREVPKNRVKFIALEQMKENEDAIYNDVLKFLEIKEFHLDSYRIINKKKVRRSQSLSRFLILITKFKRIIGLRKGLGIANKINKLNVSHNIALSSEDYHQLRKELNEYFEADIKLLERLTGLDLFNWKNFN